MGGGARVIDRVFDVDVWRSAAVLLAASGWALAAGGCLETRRPLGAQCQLNSECDAPLVCRLARCRRECATARDCAPGRACFRDEAGLGACQLPDEMDCGGDADCASGLSCVSGECAQPCDAARPCAPGARCEAGTCVDAAADACVTDADCAAPLVCALDARCRPACRADRDCLEGARCEAGACVRLPLPPLDAGAPRDAGSDAGRVGPEPDAGDAGVADASASDAGFVGEPCGTVADCSAVLALNGDLSCVANRCEVTCDAGFGDCNGVVSDGCETNFALDFDDCGPAGPSARRDRCASGRVGTRPSSSWSWASGCPARDGRQATSPAGADSASASSARATPSRWAPILRARSPRCSSRG